MNPLNWFRRRGAPTTYIPDGYALDYDRMPPGAGGMSCFKLLMLIALIIGVVAGFVAFVVFVISSSASASQPAATPTVARTKKAIDATTTSTPAETLDPWSATGTALIFATASATFTPSPTVDFCAWLTPTATATATLPFTPDAWARTGTAVFYLTNTPTPQLNPSPTTPRSWCDSPTATLTPLGLDLPVETTAAVPNTPTPVPPSATPVPPTKTPMPPALPVMPTSGGALIVPTDFPVIPPMPTIPPPPTSASTRRPTKTPTPTETATPTATDSATATPSPTSTLAATDTPHFNIYQSTCEAGYPSFSVQNIGAPLAAFVLWDIKTAEGLIVVNGFWLEEMISPDGLVTAAANSWINVPGTYILTIYQSWDALVPAQSAVAVCAAPTITETPTVTATATELLPELTQEVESSATPTETATIEVSE